MGNAVLDNLNIKGEILSSSAQSAFTFRVNESSPNILSRRNMGLLVGASLVLHAGLARYLLSGEAPEEVAPQIPEMIIELSSTAPPPRNLRQSHLHRNRRLRQNRLHRRRSPSRSRSRSRSQNPSRPYRRKR